MYPSLAVLGNVNRNGFGTGNAGSCILGCCIGYKLIKVIAFFEVNRDVEIAFKRVIAVIGVESNISRIIVFAGFGCEQAVSHRGAVFIGIFFGAIARNKIGMLVLFAECYVIVSLFSYELGNVFVFISGTARRATLYLQSVEVIGRSVNVRPFNLVVDMLFENVELGNESKRAACGERKFNVFCLNSFIELKLYGDNRLACIIGNAYGSDGGEARAVFGYRNGYGFGSLCGRNRFGGADVCNEAVNVLYFTEVYGYLGGGAGEADKGIVSAVGELVVFVGIAARNRTGGGIGLFVSNVNVKRIGCNVLCLDDFEGIENCSVGYAVGGSLEGVAVNLDIGEGDGVLKLERDVRKLSVAQKLVELRARRSTAREIKCAYGVGNTCCVALILVVFKSVNHIRTGVYVLVTGKNNVDIKLLDDGSKVFAAFLDSFIDEVIIGAEEVIVGNDYLPGNVGVCGNCLFHKFLVLCPRNVAGVNVHKEYVIVGVPIVSACFGVAVNLTIGGIVGVVKIIFVVIRIVIVVTDARCDCERGELIGLEECREKFGVGGNFNLVARRNKQGGFGEHSCCEVHCVLPVCNIVCKAACTHLRVADVDKIEFIYRVGGKIPQFRNVITASQAVYVFGIVFETEDRCTVDHFAVELGQSGGNRGIFARECITVANSEINVAYFTVAMPDKVTFSFVRADIHTEVFKMALVNNRIGICHCGERDRRNCNRKYRKK